MSFLDYGNHITGFFHMRVQHIRLTIVPVAHLDSLVKTGCHKSTDSSMSLSINTIEISRKIDVGTIFKINLFETKQWQGLTPKYRNAS